jgi:signal transduction histidine kinase
MASLARLVPLCGGLFILETLTVAWFGPPRLDGVSVLVGVAIAADCLLALAAFGGLSRYVAGGRVDNIGEQRCQERLNDEFVATVSHELRTPLTSIAGSLGLMLGGAAGRLPEPALRLMTIAHNNSQRLVRLINDLLDIEKLQSGEGRFDLQPLEFRSVVAQAIESVHGFADGYNIHVRMTGAADGRVHADSDRLIQVITNLLSNAIKFSPPGGTIEVSIEVDGGTLRLAIRDHGPGIPAELKPRIFEKFTQAATPGTRHAGGTGLGLSIAREIVVRLGGTIGFEDAPDGGTRFFVALPIAPACHEPDELEPYPHCQPMEAA